MNTLNKKTREERTKKKEPIQQHHNRFHTLFIRRNSPPQDLCSSVPLVLFSPFSLFIGSGVGSVVDDPAAAAAAAGSGRVEVEE